MVSRTTRDPPRHPHTTPPSATHPRQGSEKRQKTLFIRARVTAAEKEAVRAKAERAGLTEGAFVRTQCLDLPPKTRSIRRPPIEAAALSQILGRLGNATGNLNQIAKQMNRGRAVEDRAIDAALLEIRQAATDIMEVIGRKPKGG